MFQINDTYPPDNCAPGGRSSHLERPDATAVDGLGRPCKIVGKPKATISFQRLSITGWEWYAAFTGPAAYVEIDSISIWDAHKSGGAGYTTFAGGFMYRPTFKTFEFGSYTDVEIRFTELVEVVE